MGTDESEIVEIRSFPSSFKVHHGMCTELRKFVERIAKVFPEIEAARPGCSSGVQALCLLNNAIENAKSLLQYCSESSKLYLAITGLVIVSRCRRLKNMMEQSLSQIATMVPVMLAVKISQIIDDLREATFILDSSDEEAGKVLRELLHQDVSAIDSLECSEIKALQLAASRLCITSSKAIIHEKRSIKKLLDKIGDSGQPKRKVLKYLFYLLKKYGNSVLGDQKDNACAQEEGSYTACSQSFEANSRVGDRKFGAQTNILSRAIIPEEFKCPLSLRLMYDPVVIESGQTFERMWIQKWFEEGNHTCPKTKMKLVRLSLTPNTAMKDLISKWCMKSGITISDPSLQKAAVHSLDSSSTSISSLSSSMNDLRVPLDISNTSLGSLGTGYSSDTSSNQIADCSNLMPLWTNDDFHSYQPSTNVHDIDLSRLTELNWECQCKVIEDYEIRLEQDNQACHSLSSTNFVEPLIRFLRDARDLHDSRAQRIGCQLLLAFVSKTRSGIPYLNEDVFGLLASFLDSAATEETFAILVVLSSYAYFISKIVASGALASILNMLDSQNGQFQKLAIKILHNLSSDVDIQSHIAPSEFLPKLVPFLKDATLAVSCLVILKSMCSTELGRVCVVETSGCLPSVAELLEIGNEEDQEHAVAILLCLCSQRDQYCKLVMNEGVIPSLVNISVKGNDKAKVSALELLRLLRGVKYSVEQQCFGSEVDTSKDASSDRRKEKPSSKTSGLFGWKFPKLSKKSVFS